MRTKHETSDMSKIGVIRNMDDIPELEDELIKIFEEKSKKQIACYGLLLIQHVLCLSNIEPCSVIKECIDISERWIEGTATYHETRQAAANIPDLARIEKDPARAIVLKVVGQVTLIPHVKRHGLIASRYAITLVNLLYPNDMNEVKNERNRQIEWMRRV